MTSRASSWPTASTAVRTTLRRPVARRPLVRPAGRRTQPDRSPCSRSTSATMPQRNRQGRNGIRMTPDRHRPGPRGASRGQPARHAGRPHSASSDHGIDLPTVSLRQARSSTYHREHVATGANVPVMKAVVEAAWIASVTGIVGVAGTVIVGVAGFRSTRRATEKTVLAAHSERVWDRKADAYQVALARTRRNPAADLAR
jgi:hypothetical protein